MHSLSSGSFRHQIETGKNSVRGRTCSDMSCLLRIAKNVRSSRSPVFIFELPRRVAAAGAKAQFNFSNSAALALGRDSADDLQAAQARRNRDRGALCASRPKFDP